MPEKGRKNKPQIYGTLVLVFCLSLLTLVFLPGSGISEEAKGGVSAKRAPICGEKQEYALICEGELWINGYLKVNGPYSHVYAGKIINNGKIEVTGNLAYITEYHSNGVTEVIGGELVKAVSFPEVEAPSFEELKNRANIVFTGENGGTVYVYDQEHALIGTYTGGRYVDPSGALWRYHPQGKKKRGFWGIQGDAPSVLTGTIYFTTDLKNADHLIKINGTLVVEGDISDSGEIYVKNKPYEWAVVVGGDLFLRNRTDIWGKIYVGGNLRFTGEDGCDGAHLSSCSVPPVFKYHDKGSVIVRGGCRVNGGFYINNLDLVERVGEKVARENFGEDVEYVGTLLASSDEPGEPRAALLFYAQKGAYPDPSTIIGHLSEIDPRNVKIAVIGDSVYTPPVLYMADGLLRAYYNLKEFREKYEGEYGYPPEISDIIMMGPGDFLVETTGGELFSLERVHMTTNLEEIKLSPGFREGRREYMEWYRSTFKDTWDNLINRNLSEWEEEMRETEFTQSSTQHSLKLSEENTNNTETIKSLVTSDAICTLPLDTDAPMMKRAAIFTGFLFDVWKVAPYRTRVCCKCASLFGQGISLEKDPNTGEYVDVCGKYNCDSFDTSQCMGRKGVSCIEAIGDNILLNGGKMSTVTKVKEGIVSATIAAYYREGDGPLCQMPHIYGSIVEMTNFDEKYLKATCEFFSLLYALCYEFPCVTPYNSFLPCHMDVNNIASCTDVDYEKRCKIVSLFRALGYTVSTVYENYTYPNVPWSADFACPFWDDDWNKVLKNTFNDYFCNGYFTAIQYGYVDIDIWSFPWEGEGVKYSSPIFIVTSYDSYSYHWYWRTYLTYSGFDFYDCYYTSSNYWCVKQYKIKTNLSFWTNQAAFMNRFHLKPPTSDPRCQGGGGGGGGCTISAESAQSLRGDILLLIIIVTLIRAVVVRRISKCSGW